MVSYTIGDMIAKDAEMECPYPFISRFEPMEREDEYCERDSRSGVEGCVLRLCSTTAVTKLRRCGSLGDFDLEGDLRRRAAGRCSQRRHLSVVSEDYGRSGLMMAMIG